jgi:hypothetical protein
LEDNRPVDIIFYGICSVRRAIFLNQLLERFHPLGIVVDLICITASREGVVEGRLAERLSRAKIALVMHSHAQSSLPVHRVMYLMRHEKCVVSELNPSDPELDWAYRWGAVFTGPLEQFRGILDVLEVLLHDPMKLQLCERMAMAQFHSLHRGGGELTRAIVAAVETLTS